MSIKIQKELLVNLKKGEQMQFAMFKKAQEMIEMMEIVKRDARKRAFHYRKMIKAMEAGRIQETKQLYAEMQTWRKYKIIEI